MGGTSGAGERLALDASNFTTPQRALSAAGEVIPFAFNCLRQVADWA
jgi:hypothetical protein